MKYLWSSLIILIVLFVLANSMSCTTGQRKFKDEVKTLRTYCYEEMLGCRVKEVRVNHRGEVYCSCFDNDSK